MKKRLKTIPGTVLFMLSLGMTAPLAFAHGDESHAKKTYDPAKAEQKEFGKAGDPKKAARTVKFDMTDQMRFTPDSITIKQGETVKFVLKNNGKIMHEMVIGTMKDLKEHAELMKKFPDMEHEEPYMAHVKPGKTEEIIWTFNKPGEFNFACLIAGHFEAGMVGKVKVVGRDGHVRSH
ncbi:MAG: cupredoxin domain-containing protein [Noviherbaspirillum sp.]